MLKRAFMFWMGLCPLALNAMTVDVFSLKKAGDSKRTVADCSELESLNSIAERFSNILSQENDKETALNVAEAMYEQYQSELSRQARRYSKIHALGLAKLPAVVVDSHYVVYGTDNWDEALKRIQAYKGAGQ